jgi:hypothetical protein
MIFVPWQSRRRRLPEDSADALKRVGVLTIYKILFIYIYIYVVHLLVWIINSRQFLVRLKRTVKHLKGN